MSPRPDNQHPAHPCGGRGFESFSEVGLDSKAARCYVLRMLDPHLSGYIALGGSRGSVAEVMASE